MQIKCPHCGRQNRFSVNKIGDNPTCGACHMGLLTEPIALNQANFLEILSQSHLPVIVDFWASWCGPCKTFAPTFKASTSQFSGSLIFAKVDTEAEQMLSSQYEIRSIPTLVYFWRGKELGRISGALPPKQLNDLALKVIQLSNEG